METIVPEIDEIVKFYSAVDIEKIARETDFDVFTQSFFRYVSASVFLFAVGLIFDRKKILGGASNLRMLLIPAVIMAVHQIFFTAGVFMTSAVVSSLMGRLNVILIPAFSCIFYADERRVVGNKNFLMGAFLAIVGVMGVILGRKAIAIDGFNLGTVFIMMGTLCWSIYAVYIKRLVKSIDPLAIIAFVSLLSIFFFLPVVLIFGDIRKIADVSIKTNILLFGSGILGVGVGNVFYYHAIKHVGTSIATIFLLLLPLSERINIEYTVQIWKEGNQFIAHAMPLDVMSSGQTPEEARKALDEAVHLFLETAANMETLDEILHEAGYEFVSENWRSPSWVAIERHSITVGI